MMVGRPMGDRLLNSGRAKKWHNWGVCRGMFSKIRMLILLMDWWRLFNSPANSHELYKQELSRAWEPLTSLGISLAGKIKVAHFFVFDGNKNEVF